MTAIAPRATDLKAAVAQILYPSGHSAGTALLLLNGFVATCAHVVRGVTKLERGSVPPETTRVHLRFPSAAHVAKRQEPYVARLARGGWRPEWDLAILRIEGELPFHDGWRLDGALTNEMALDVDCFGFGKTSKPDGATAECRIPTMSIIDFEARLLRRGENEEMFVESGFSGGPVYVHGTQQVIGLLRRGNEQVQNNRNVARLILARYVNEAFVTAYNTDMAEQGQSAENTLAPAFAAARQGVDTLSRHSNMLRQIPEALQDHLSDLEEAVTNPARIEEACECLAGLERQWRKARERDLDVHFHAFGLDQLSTMLATVVPKLKETAARIAPEAKGDVVPNDWDVDKPPPHVQDFRKLLDLIAQRKAVLSALPESQPRNEALAVLARLKKILYDDPLALAAVDAVRVDLERFDRDVFAVLICECQMLLARYVTRLPDGAVFRDRLADGTPGPEMVAIPAGRFMMGSPEDEKGRFASEGPRHEVTIGYRFALGRYAVTFEEYDRFVAATGGREPSDHGWGRGRRPVIDVSWEDAQAYARWLSVETGQSYRLPSEAEWEYACRAGTTTPFHTGETISTSQANFDGNFTYVTGAKGEYRRQTMPVGSFPPNAFGLYDMHGNVWEWVEDVWHENYTGAPVDGSARTTNGSNFRVNRGGSWNYYPRSLRSAYRDGSSADLRSNLLGFRLARTFLSLVS
ncbi:MAG: SUMF1/EgtB/PvdO family nonheme iron enzyme [Alphaproteobacteria bacterium]